ncbi:MULTISPECIES: S1 RNA-binding domain-containing protein [unclassified Streptomyces]|uniref:S1 RNA-binding domain-containing protein n=1 Tax=unclassified Streptomyces TaxID=2593676 RepID=UPI001B7D0DB8|nr:MULTISPECIES: S1 RNA-binding domain-containing protein [unclassified Streptomyces]
MSEPAPDPRLQSLINKLRPGSVRTVTVAGFDGADVLVLLGESGEEGSEVGRIPQDEVSIRRTNHPSEIFTIGQQIEAEEIGRWRGQLNFSARACENPELRAFLVAIQPGQIVSGTVSGVHNFGVFVHLDGEPEGLCTGFIRGPDLTWDRINHPSEAAEVGQRITGEVLMSETRNAQVTISLKALLEDPLVRFADQTGHVLDGTVTKIIPFGVFVRLAPGIEGLLHVSEMTDSPGESPDQLVSEGDQITVRVAEVDLQRHRVRLCAHVS